MSNRPDDAGAELAARFDVDERERYATGRALGRGGMGEVRAAQDLRLDREVALKVLHRPDPAAEARLAREASLAARLEHPGIVPVYTAGRLPDGRAYYAMRVIRGRSLAQLLRDAPDLAARLRLMRHVLDVAEAVAYAHDHGVLHRDLKPANVMVGEHGETAVVDWGLAIELDRPPRAAPPPAAQTWSGVEPAPEPTWNGDGPASAPSGLASASWSSSSSGARGLPATGELTRPGQIIGTPAYMPPEQARGETLDRRADVYALGGVLYTVLAGAPPRASDNPFAPVPPLTPRCPNAPPELVAITTRAMDPDRDRRYPDAGALAADLEAWLDGRRVAAYDYSVWQTLRRVYALWRLPLNLGALALVALAIAVGVGWWRTTTERNRAIEAERVAIDARAASDRALAAALSSQARVATVQGDRAAAEILAANRLRFGEDPEARGILAQLGGQARPRLLTRRPLPDCSSRSFSLDVAWVACVQSEQVLVINAATGEVTRVHQGTAQDVTFSHDSRWMFISNYQLGVQAIDLETGRVETLDGRTTDLLLDPSMVPDSVIATQRKVITLLSVGAGAPRPVPPCPDGSPGERQVRDLGGGRFLMRCTVPTNEIYNFFLVDWSGGGRLLFQLDRTDGVPTALVGDGVVKVLIGTDRGWVVQYDLGTGRLRKLATGLPTITSLATGGGRIAACGSRGGAVVLDAHSGRVFARLPTSGSASAGWIADGRVLRVVGSSIDDWELPPMENPHLYADETGVAAVAMTVDGARLAVGYGQGEVRVFDRVTGDLLSSARLRDSVVKDIAFSPDGGTIAVASGLSERSSLFTVEPSPREQPLGVQALRRLLWTGSNLFLAPYKGGLISLPGGDPEAPRRVWPMPVEVGDMDALSDGAGLVIVNQEGRLYHLDLDAANPHLAPLGEALEARALAASRRVVWVARARSVVRIDVASGERVEHPFSGIGSGITEIATSPGDRWLAIGLFDGTTLIVDGQQLAARAILRGHDARVGTAAFDGSGRWLVTGGWDGDVHVWDLSTLMVPPDELVGPIQDAWGMDLESVLRSAALNSD